MSTSSSQDDGEQIDLRSLIDHTKSVQVRTPIELVQTLFGRSEINFVAVAEGHALVGVCGRRHLSRQLSSQYGYALFAHQPVSSLMIEKPLCISLGTPITEVFERAAAREVTEFFDDVVLVDPNGRYLGMIPMRTLVRLQTKFLTQQNAELELSRAEVAKKNREIEDDIAMARQVQLAIMPGPLDRHTTKGRRLSIASRYLAASGMSGDFFDVISLSEEVVGILVCDVMGHGVRSALIAGMVSAMVEGLRPIASDAGQFLTRLNRELCHVLQRTGELIFVTAAYVVVDLENSKFGYSQAGHPTPLYWEEEATGWAHLPCAERSRGPALGLMDDSAYGTTVTPISGALRLLMFTDGVIEAATGSGEEFGLVRLASALERNPELTLEEMLDQTLTEVGKFSGEALADDICLVAVECSRRSIKTEPESFPARAPIAVNSPIGEVGKIREHSVTIA